MSRAYTPRINAGGNFCGHDPAKPRFVVKANPYAEDVVWKSDQKDDLGHGKKPLILYATTEKLNEAYKYRKILPTLGYLTNPHDGKNRKHRSEGVEGAITLLGVMVHYMELSSVNWDEGFARVGTPTKNGFLYFDNKFWIQKTGLTESRLKRAFKLLKKAGLVKRKRRWIEREQGRFKGLATMTLISLTLFQQLDLVDLLKDSAEHAYEKLKMAARRLQTTISNMLSCSFGDQKRYKQPTKPKAKPEDFHPSDPQHWICQLYPKQKREFQDLYTQVLMDDPSRLQDPISLYREAYIAIKQHGRLTA